MRTGREGLRMSCAQHGRIKKIGDAWDVRTSVSKLRETGCVPLGTPQPALAFNGARVIFFLTPLKLIFELIEDESGKV